MMAREWTDAECDARAHRPKRLGRRPPDRWAGNGGWTPAGVALLTSLPDDEVTARVGRSADAARTKQRRLANP